MNENIRIKRSWSMPNKNTFDILPIKEFIEKNKVEGIIIDPFANKNRIATITNDLDEQYDADYHMDALEFLKMFDDNSVDMVLYDPPYSPRQVSECYKTLGKTVNMSTTQASYWSNHKKEISRIVKDGGKVITFGWNSGEIGKKYGFEITDILMVAHGGWHNDTLCTLEVKKDKNKKLKKINKNTIKKQKVTKNINNTKDNGKNLEQISLFL